MGQSTQEGERDGQREVGSDGVGLSTRVGKGKRVGVKG